MISQTLSNVGQHYNFFIETLKEIGKEIKESVNEKSDSDYYCFELNEGFSINNINSLYQLPPKFQSEIDNIHRAQESQQLLRIEKELAPMYQHIKEQNTLELANSPINRKIKLISMFPNPEPKKIEDLGSIIGTPDVVRYYPVISYTSDLKSSESNLNS